MTRKDTSDDALVERLQEQVRVAKGVASIPDLDLLDDAETNPAMRQRRTKLSARRQRDRLRTRHRSELRAQRRTEWDAAMDDRGHRLMRRRELADSPARRAASLERLQHGVVGIGAVGIVGMGAASTAGVHQGLVELIGPSVAAAAWGYEPAVIALVAGGIVARSVLHRAGGVMPTAVTALEWVALATSIVLSIVGSGFGAALFPTGTAVLALVMQQILGAVADADVHAQRTTTAPGAGGWRTVLASVAGRGGPAEEDRRPEDALEGEVHQGLAAAEDYLRTASEPEADPAVEAGDGGGLALADPPADGQSGPGHAPDVPPGDDGAASTEPGPDGTPARGEDTAPPALEEAARRRSDDAQTTVWRYYMAHPEAPVKTAARELDMDPKTVRKYRPAVSKPRKTGGDQ
ncbi:hypothetical protein HNR25_005182 [Streptomonospora salina]|uniref:Uncharacterized protein n=1 Tax=Streptomonospora salina TaxID=104205 RepID=A0A841EPJ3_9ACTN|nr:hypothetical protein [Streptomonospora salina]MBB6001351.1 hypothetical protein [Streptomonospora salina]